METSEIDQILKKLEESQRQYETAAEAMKKLEDENPDVYYNIIGFAVSLQDASKLLKEAYQDKAIMGDIEAGQRWAKANKGKPDDWAAVIADDLARDPQRREALAAYGFDETSWKNQIATNPGYTRLLLRKQWQSKRQHRLSKIGDLASASRGEVADYKDRFSTDSVKKFYNKIQMRYAAARLLEGPKPPEYQDILDLEDADLDIHAEESGLAQDADLYNYLKDDLDVSQALAFEDLDTTMDEKASKLVDLDGKLQDKTEALKSIERQISASNDELANIHKLIKYAQGEFGSITRQNAAQSTADRKASEVKGIPPGELHPVEETADDDADDDSEDSQGEQPQPGDGEDEDSGDSTEGAKKVPPQERGGPSRHEQDTGRETSFIITRVKGVKCKVLALPSRNGGYSCFSLEASKDGKIRRGRIFATLKKDEFDKLYKEKVGKIVTRGTSEDTEK